MEEIENEAFASSGIKTLTVTPSFIVFYYMDPARFDKSYRAGGNWGAAFSMCNRLEKINLPQNFTFDIIDESKNGAGKITLYDLFSGETINASFALQKQLKGISRTTPDYSAVQLEAYNKAFAEGKYEEAASIAIEFYSSWKSRGQKDKWENLYKDARNKPYLDKYTAAVEGGDYSAALQIAKDAENDFEQDSYGHLLDFETWRANKKKIEDIYAAELYMKAMQAGDYDKAASIAGENKWTERREEALKQKKTARMEEKGYTVEEAADFLKEANQDVEIKIWKADKYEIEELKSALLDFKYKVTLDLASCTALMQLSVNMFKDCTSLVAITLPPSIKEFSPSAFAGCSSLERIVAVEGGKISSEDGVLYNEEKTTLYAFPQAKGGTFSIPESVKKIYTLAFWYNSSLKSITIPQSVTEIGEGAFYSCAALKNFNYRGSKKQWKKIRIEPKWNDLILKAKVKFDYKGN